MNVNNPFVRVGRFLLNHAKAVLLISLVAYGLLLTQLANIRLDTSAEGYLNEDAPVILEYDQFREEFGRDEFFILAISADTVFSIEFLTALKELHEAIALKMPYLESVESLVNVRSIYGEDDDLIAEDLLETLPQDEQELKVLVDRIRRKPIYYDRLINRDEDTITILIKQQSFIPKEGENGETVYKHLEDPEVLEGYHVLINLKEQFIGRFSNGEIHVSGSPAIGAYMSDAIQKDFGVLTSVAIAMVFIMLWLLFKRWSGVFISLAVMVFSISSCIAMMPLLGYPMQITSSILPSFLLAVCIGDSVHLLSIFYRFYDEGETKFNAILHALDHTGLAVLFTTITTSVGLLTFSISDVRPIASLGLFAAIGSSLAFLATVVLIPTLIALFPIKAKSASDKDQDKMQEGNLMYRFTTACIKLSTTHPKKILAVSLVLFAACVAVIPSVRFAQNAMKWFPDETPVKAAVKFVERKITGSMPLEMVIDLKEEQGAIDPAFLQKLDAWLSSIEGQKFNGIKVISVNALTTLIKETHQAFNGNSDEQYIIPDDKELIAQELLLVEMDQADDLYGFVDHSFSRTRITLIVPWADAIKMADFQDELRASYTQYFDPEALPLELTGMIPIFSRLFAAMVYSAAQSYLIAAAVITLMMMLLLRKFTDGLLSMIPNLLPIMLVIAVMTLMDIPMDIFTMLIGSIALGLCVDDTVHFMHGFKTHYAKHGNAQKAIEDTLYSTGKALITTSVVLFMGFMIYTLSSLNNMILFGQLTASCIVLALLADFIIAPAIMKLKYDNKKEQD